MVSFRKLFALFIVMFLGCATLFNQAYAAPKESLVTVKTDVAKIYQGESFNIIIEVVTTKTLKANDLKYEALKQSFSVGNIEFGSYKGKIENTIAYRWKIPAIAKQVGVIRIPAMSIGKDLKTPDSELKVQTVNIAPNTVSQHGVIKTQLRNTHPMENQLTMYRLEINKSDEFKIENITPPSAPGAKVELFAERTISKASGGNRFNKTLVREYKIFFKKPGKTVIKSPIVQCIDVRTNKRFIKQDKDINVDVSASPDPTAIVSENLSVVVTWTPKERDVGVGTPITRTITLRGTNNTLSQLPMVALPNFKNFDSYEENTQESEKLMKNKQLIATRVIRQVFVPKENHTRFDVSEINFTWVNPNDKSIHKEVIEGASYVIDGFSFTDFIPQNSKHKTWLIIGIICSLLFSVFVFYSIKWYRHRVGIYAHIHTYIDRRKYWSQFNKQWSNTDPFQARNAIINWAQKRWPNLAIVGLNNLPFYQSIKEEAEILSASCWSQDHSQWNGSKLHKLIAKNKNYKKPKAKQGINPFGLNGEIYETVQQKLK